MLSVLRRLVNPVTLVSYLLALSFVAAIGAVAVVQLNRISATVTRLAEGLAAEKDLADDIVNQVLLARFYAQRYVRTEDQTDADRFGEEFARLEHLLVLADQQITDQERVEMLGHVKLAVEAYGEALDEAADIVRERQRVYAEVLDIQERLIVDRLTALRVHLVSASDPRVFLAFGNAQNAFQAMHLNTVRYLEAGDEKFAVQMEMGYRQAQEALLVLETHLADSTQRENISDARFAAEAYYRGFQAIQAEQARLRDLLDIVQETLEPKIARAASSMAISINAELESQNTLSQSLVTQARVVMVLTTLIAVLTGAVLGVVIVRHAVERTRAEEALREAQDQLARREKLAMLGQMAGSVSHELRNPLGVIGNAAYYLQMVLPEADGTPREYLDIITSEVRNAEKTIADLLDFARTRAPDKEEVAVSTLVAGVLEKRPPPGGVEVIVDVLPDLPAMLVDPGQMEIVLVNLITNAYQAMPDGGLLTVRAETGERARSLAETRAGGEGDSPVSHPPVRVSISDTGCGIPSDDMGKLFRSLFTTKAQGVGLGLVICKSLVEANGGSIEVTSEEGRGSTFVIRLPRCESHGSTEGGML